MSIKLKDTIYDLVKSSENSDTLDGIHLSGLYHSKRGTVTSSSLSTYINRNSGTWGVTYSGHTGLLAVLSNMDSSNPSASGSTTSIELLADHYDLTNGLKVRTSIDGSRFSGWKTLAFLSDIPTIGTRNIPINGTKYTVHSSIASDTAAIYAPTTVGTAGQVVKSNGSGAPSWISQSSLSVGSSVTAQKLTTQAATMWGRSYWLSGIPQSIDGDMTNVGNISFKKDASENRSLYIKNTGSIQLRSALSGGCAMAIASVSNDGSKTLGAIGGAYTQNNELYYLYYGGTAYDNPAMIINSSGNIGMGTTSPAQKLDVGGGVRSVGFYKNGSNNNYVLLAGGGHKALSEFSITSHTHKYAGSQSVGGPADEVVCGPGSADAYRNLVVTTGSNAIFYNTKVSANYATGKVKVGEGILVTSTDSKPHIEFSRVGWNYLTVPVSGSLAISVGGNNGETARLVVENSTVFPGYTSGTVNLGKSEYPWNTVYANSFSGNAASATKLLNSRTINGTSFNGTGNITTANWGTTRTITIGDKGKSVNGSANVTWTLSEIGASPVGHTHSTYLPLAGGTMTGVLNITDNTSYIASPAGSAILGYGTTATFTGAYSSSTSNKSTVVGSISSPTMLRSSANNLYHYREDLDNRYIILDAYNYSSYCAPTSHTHTIAQVTNLQSTLDGKAPKVHSHSEYALADHNHNSLYVSNVTISGDYLRVTKNGSGTNLTIPYSEMAGGLTCRGRLGNLGNAAMNGVYSYSGSTDQPTGYGAVLQWSNVNEPSPGTNQHWITQLASGTDGTGLWYRTRTNTASWKAWVRLDSTVSIPTSLKNPYSLTIKTNGTSQAIYDGSSTKSVDITYANVGAAKASHIHEFHTVKSSTSNATFPFVFTDNSQGDTSTGNRIWSAFGSAFGVNPYTQRIYCKGIVKATSSDSYVLLGGGGHKALSDFSLSGHSHGSDYLPLSMSAATYVVNSQSSGGVVNFRSSSGKEVGIRLYLGSSNSDTYNLGGLWANSSNGIYMYNAKKATKMGIDATGPYFESGSTRYTLLSASSSSTNDSYPIVGLSLSPVRLLYKTSGLTMNPYTGQINAVYLRVNTNSSNDGINVSSKGGRAIYASTTGNQNAAVFSNSNSTGYAWATIDATCKGSTAYGLNTNGIVRCVKTEASSDRRLKNNIQKLTEQEKLVSLMDNIDLVSFCFNDDETNLAHYGFIAQDILPHYPELVGKGEYLSLDYNSCFALKIANLERKIRTLEAKISQLEGEN